MYYESKRKKAAKVVGSALGGGSPLGEPSSQTDQNISRKLDWRNSDPQ